MGNILYTRMRAPGGLTGSRERLTPHLCPPFRQLREEFDRGVDVQLDEEHSIHDVAALLKEFLRDMPDPLLTRELYTAFINTTCRVFFFFIILFSPCTTYASISSRITVLELDEQHSVTQLLVHLLPACNSDTLYRLLQFLSTVTDHAHDRLDKDGQEVSYGGERVGGFEGGRVSVVRSATLGPFDGSGRSYVPESPTWNK